jgi:DUF971 family protein
MSTQTEPLRPTALCKDGPDRLRIDWNDGHRSVYTWKHLRAKCPCASCRDEHSQPADPFHVLSARELEAGPLLPVAINPMGYYAYQITWNDGHDSGIFTLEHLRELCQCEECLAKAAKSTAAS